MRWSIAMGLLTCLIAAGVVLGGPIGAEQKSRLELPAWQHTSRFLGFRAGERALVIATGTGQSPLALYVYDSDGNCVARDDVVEPRGSSDDVAVEWVPAEQARFGIELRNLGSRTNRVDMVTR